MKNRAYLFFLLIITLSLSCKTQQTQIKNSLPKIENYTKGELEIMVGTFSSESPISIGKVTADGTIHFDFPILDLDAMGEMEGTYFFNMQSIGRAAGMFVCHDKGIELNTENVGAIEVKFFHLYKYGQPVGAILPAFSQEMLDDKFAIGSTISWFYSNGDGKFKANCTTYEEDDSAEDGLDRNTIRNKTSYAINFKEGWNMVTHSLLEKKEMTNDGYQFTRRLIEEKTSVVNIPPTLNWYLEYFANDELLEIEHQLAMLKPIAKQRYENWLPQKLGNLKRTEYEVGKKIERMPTTNNVNLLFENGSKKVDLTIVDCADNKDTAGVYTLMKDMASRDWKDDKEAGYESASNMDDKRVMTIYNKKEAKTTLSYNTNGRFMIKAEGINMNPEDLWAILQTLDLDALVK